MQKVCENSKVINLIKIVQYIISITVPKHTNVPNAGEQCAKVLNNTTVVMKNNSKSITQND